MSIFWFFLFTIISCFLLLSVPGEFSAPVFISSLIIQIYSLFFVFYNKNRPFSLNKTFYLFCFFFFGIAPYLQFITNTSINGARALKENEFFLMNILIIFILILYQLIYFFYLKNKTPVFLLKTSDKFQLKEKISETQGIKLLILSFSAFFVILYIRNFNILGMLLRGAGDVDSMSISKSTSLIISRVIQPIPMMCLLYVLFSKTKNFILIISLIILTLITNSPLSMSRFMTAALYIPLMLTLFKFMRKENIFSLVFIGGLLIVFPFLNQFRYYNPDRDLTVEIDVSMFTTGHFDSFYNFALIVFENIITWGRQLLGVLFFWVPRSFWPSKPIGSGAFLSEQGLIFFPNASANYFAEGYINFGFFGILLFIILIAYLTAKLDKLYWETLVDQNKNYFQVIYYVVIGMLFLLLRGDLMSGFSFTLSLVLSIFIVKKVVN